MVLMILFVVMCKFVVFSRCVCVCVILFLLSLKKTEHTSQGFVIYHDCIIVLLLNSDLRRRRITSEMGCDGFKSVGWWDKDM